MSGGSELNRTARLVAAGLGFVLLLATCQASRDNGRDGGVAGGMGGLVAGGGNGAGVGGSNGGAAGWAMPSETGGDGGGQTGAGATAGGSGVGAAGGIKGECPRAYVAPGGAFGSAGACGEAGQPCCPGAAEGKCNTGFTFCDWSSGSPLCIECGGMNQPCCWRIAWGGGSPTWCFNGACDATTYPGICTDKCGRPGEPCCPGLNCWTTNRCLMNEACPTCEYPYCQEPPLSSTFCWGGA
jgi:hypothetical protein